MGSLHTIYKKKNYKIYDAGGEYIVHNSSLNFEQHHSHITKYETCVFIIHLCLHKSVPRHLSEYLLVSILRLSDDTEYKKLIQKKLDQERRKKGKHYYERQSRTNTSGNRTVCRSKSNKVSSRED